MSGSRVAVTRARLGGRRGSAPVSAAHAASPLARLQRVVGNQAIASLVAAGAPILQRWPMPSQSTLNTSADYKGGKFNKGSWAALGKLLEEYPKKPSSKESVKPIRAATTKVRQSFTAKKIKKVGAGKLATVTTALDALDNDCDIADTRIDLEAILTKSGLTEQLVAQGRQLVQDLERLARFSPQTDNTGVLAKEIASATKLLDDHEDKLLTVYRVDLENLLQGAGYHPEQGRKNYWHPPDIAYRLPHVAWKGHVGASRSTAIRVAKQAIPILLKLGVDHKFDTHPRVFEGTNKFLTIYPPPPNVDWSDLIAQLEGNFDAHMPPVPGELPVGKTGAIGMRHGQITALGVMDLEVSGIGVIPISSTKISFGNLWLLQAKLEARPTEKDKAPAQVPQVDTLGLPGGQLCLGSDKVIYFSYSEGKEEKLAPAVWTEGVIKPDPRKQPNPYNVPLPKGVTSFM